MDTQEAEEIDKHPYSVSRSLCMKAVMLVAGLLLTLWIGWPVPQQTEHSWSRLPPSPAPIFSPGQDTHSASKQVFPKQNLTDQQEVGTSQKLRNPGIVITHHRSLDVNTGSRKEFKTLPGIGPVLANRIVQYRESHGPFYSLEELMNVQGIGKGRLARLRPYIVVRGS